MYSRKFNRGGIVLGDKDRNNEVLINEILNSIQDDFYIIDHDWNFVFTSNRFTSRVGKDPEDFIGINIWKMYPKHIGTAYEKNLREAMVKREIRRFDVGDKYTDAFCKMIVFPSDDGITVLRVDITERRKLEIELKYQKELFETVIETMHDAIAIYDSNGKVSFLNAEIRRLYPFLDDKSSVSDVQDNFEYFDLEGNVIPKAKLPTSRVCMGEKIRGERIIIKRPDRLQYTEINATPIFNKENSLLSMVVVHRDISELILNQQEIKNNQDQLLSKEISKNELLKVSMEMKDEFLYLITHEFKTPMAIINFALQAIESLCKDDVTERLARYLNTIKINTNRQLRLVNNLLDVTQINTGNIKIHRRKLDIVFLTRSIVNSVEIYAVQKNISLKFESTFVKKEIYFDEEKFERIMLNLLSNALKFTPKDKCITILLSIKKKNNKNYIDVSVKDEGIGISVDNHKKIFDRFGQVDTSLSRQAEGTGLGLYLVALLVKALEGEITLKSEIGKGSTFTVLLPIIKSIPLEEVAISREFNNQLIGEDSRIVQAAYIELSDLYFD